MYLKPKKGTPYRVYPPPPPRLLSKSVTAYTLRTGERIQNIKVNFAIYCHLYIYSIPTFSFWGIVYCIKRFSSVLERCPSYREYIENREVLGKCESVKVNNSVTECVTVDREVLPWSRSQELRSFPNLESSRPTPARAAILYRFRPLEKLQSARNPCHPLAFFKAFW